MIGAIPLCACVRQRPDSATLDVRGAPGDDDDGDVVRLAVLVEVLEAGIELDVWWTGQESALDLTRAQITHSS